MGKPIVVSVLNGPQGSRKETEVAVIAGKNETP